MKLNIGDVTINQSLGSKIKDSIITNIVTYITIFIISSVAIYISYLIRNSVDFRELFLDTTIFYIWIGINIFVIVYAIFSICYILINRKPKEFIYEYKSTDFTNQIYSKVKIGDSLYFNCYTAPPKIYNLQDTFISVDRSVLSVILA